MIRGSITAILLIRPLIYPIEKISNTTVITDNTTNVANDGNTFNLSQGLSSKYKIDSAGSEWTVDLSYNYSPNNSDQSFINSFSVPVIPASGGDGKINTRLNFISAQTNFLYKFPKKLTLETGLKSSFVGFNNTTDYFRTTSGDRIKDIGRTSSYDYKENINALYVNYNRQFKGIMIQAGVRMENTNVKATSQGVSLIDGENVPFDSTFDKNYTDFFPSAAVTFNKNPMNQWSISYSRRIDRPAYQDLNPFEFRLDKYTFQQGNTQLRPQYTNSIAVTNTFKYKLTTTLNYSHVTDVFSQIVDTADASKAFITKKNLATQDIVSLNISMPFQYKWYSVFANVNTYYSKYKANFGEGRTVNLDVFATNVYMQNTFKVAKKTTIELSGFYTSPSIWQGTFKSKAMGGVDVGVQQTVLKGKGNVKATVTDIFHTMQWGGTSDFAGQYLKTSGGWESRQFRLNFTYRFGNAQVKAARQRKTSAEDESKRVGSQGGGIGGN